MKIISLFLQKMIPEITWFRKWKYWVIAIAIIFILLILFTAGRQEIKFTGIDTETFDKEPLKTSKDIMGDRREELNQLNLSNRYDFIKSTKNKNNKIEENIIESDNESVEDIEDLIPPVDGKFIYESLTIDQTPKLPSGIEPNFDTSGKNDSKGEISSRKILESIYNKPFAKKRPNWLANPETGYNLELDCFNEELRIALEYQGIQHHVFPNKFMATVDDFIKQVRRDKFKRKRCDEEGIYLITVPYSVPLNKLTEYITYYLPENVLMRNYEAQKAQEE